MSSLFFQVKICNMLQVYVTNVTRPDLVTYVTGFSQCPDLVTNVTGSFQPPDLVTYVTGELACPDLVTYVTSRSYWGVWGGGFG